MPKNDLLQPSLSASDATGVSIYSTAAGYIVSYFGGPLAAAIIALLNSFHLGRLHKDWPFGALALLAVPGYFKWLQVGGGQRWLSAVIGQWSIPYVYRLMGVLFFGLAYLMHRRYYRSMALIGVPARPGWIPGVGAVMAGMAYAFLVVEFLINER